MRPYCPPLPQYLWIDTPQAYGRTNLGRFCSKFVWRKICVEKISVEKKWQIRSGSKSKKIGWNTFSELVISGVERDIPHDVWGGGWAPGPRCRSGEVDLWKSSSNLNPLSQKTPLGTTQIPIEFYLIEHLKYLRISIQQVAFFQSVLCSLGVKDVANLCHILKHYLPPVLSAVF